MLPSLSSPAACPPLLPKPNPQSLTFSASDDAYLFSPVAPPPTATPSCVTALEHVNGTVLFQQVRALNNRWLTG